MSRLLLSSPTVVTARRFLFQNTTRALSALPKSTSDVVLPTRHSRHLPPPVCRDAVELQDLTEELVKIQFIPYTLGEEDNVWESNDNIIQKAEFVIRGHAACIPETLWYQSSKEIRDVESPPTHHVSSMQAILHQLEEQNKVYMNLRRQLQSQVTTTYHDDSSSSSSSSDESDDSDDETNTFGGSMAGPGTTVDMWDTLLDSMAVTSSAKSPVELKELLEHVLLRHHQDGGPEYNTNPYTVPTVLTFNAVLRGVVNTDYQQDNPVIRDEALEVAFGVYDEMRWHVDRNSATFQYMLQVVQKFLPPSRSRGNIAHGIWTQAKRHHVASSQVLSALQQAHVPSNGKEFDEWCAQHDDIRKTPLDWRKQHKMKRYNRKSGTY